MSKTAPVVILDYGILFYLHVANTWFSFILKIIIYLYV